MPINNWSKREAVGDAGHGFKVVTSEVEASVYWDTIADLPIFNVYGRVKLLELYTLVTEDMAGAGALPNYGYIGTTPSCAAIDIAVESTDVAGLEVGDRHVWIGGTVAGVCSIAGAPGQSIGRTGVPFIIGGVTGAGVNFIGTINTSGKTAAATDGNLVFHCVYAPMSDGAYVEAAI